MKLVLLAAFVVFLLGVVWIRLGQIKNEPQQHWDRVYYLNLEERQDRKAEVLAELEAFGIEEARIQRINAHKHEVGAIGCARSHLEALDDAIQNNYDSILIVEDDFQLKPEARAKVDLFYQLNVEYDCLLLAAYTKQFEETHLDFVLKSVESQTTCAYALKRPYFEKIRDVFAESNRVLTEAGYQKKGCAIDQAWKVLQPQDRWYVLRPVVAHQRDGFSSIEQKAVEYPDKYELPVKGLTFKDMTRTSDQLVLGEHTIQLVRGDKNSYDLNKTLIFKEESYIDEILNASNYTRP